MKKLIAQGSLLALLAIWATINWPALTSLHFRWVKLDEPYAIGYPVFFVALWQIYESRGRLLNCRVSPSALALWLFLMAAAMALAARLVQFQLLQQMIVPISLWLLIVTIAGWRLGRVLLFPFLLLYLAIPLWDALVNPLRWFTVAATQHALDLARIPAFIRGFQISLPDGIIEVEDGCSGLNLLLSAAVVGAVQFHLMTSGLLRRSLIAALAIAIGVLDNWIRVIIIVLVGHFSHMQSSLVYHHGNFGWAVFVVSLFPFFIAVRWLDRADHLKSAALPALDRAEMPYKNIASYGVSAALGAVVLLAATTFLEQRHGNSAALLAPPLAAPAQPEWLPQYAGFDQQQAWRAHAHGASYDILVLSYFQQTTNKKLIYFSNRIADERHTLESSTIAVSDALTINQTIINTEGPRVVWWFYLIDSHVVTGGVSAKWHQLMGLLRGNQHTSLVTISTLCASEDCSDILRDRGFATADVGNLLDSWLTQKNGASN